MEKEKQTIYISGKISGIEEQASSLFEYAEEFLISQGYNTINPMKLKHTDLSCWKTCMKIDIKAMMDCDKIYMLSNWQTSIGAKAELKLALDLGMEVIMEGTIIINNTL
jgi:hypothetical protein